MTVLNTTFGDEECLIMNKCADENLQILPTFEKQCYLLNMYGEFTFEECFGRTDNYLPIVGDEW